MSVRVIFLTKEFIENSFTNKNYYSQYKFFSFQSNNSLELTEFYQNAQQIR